MHLNIRSLKNKMPEVKNIIKEHSPHILGLSECELTKDKIEVTSLKVPGYDLLFPSSWNINGQARVVVYVKKSFKYKQVETLQVDDVQSVWIQGGFHQSKGIMFCHSYREHLSGQNTASQLSYMKNFLDQWDAATEYGNSSQLNEVHVMCDMNVDMLNERLLEPDYHLLHLSRLIKSACDVNNLHQLVKNVTRIQYNSVSKLTDMSCIDHVYTNMKHRCSFPVIIPFGDSDHDIVSYTRYSKELTSPSKVVCKRNYKNFFAYAFLVDVSSIDWSDVLISFDIDIATAHLSRKFNAVLDVHAPWVKLQQRKYFVPWISNKTKELIKARDS